FSATDYGHLEVDLHGPACPGPTKRIVEVVIDLRAIECPVARQLGPLQIAGPQSSAQRRFGAVPGSVRTDALLRTKRQPDGDVLEAEILVDAERKPIECSDLGLDLLRTAEDVPVILRKGAYAHDAMQGARGFVAVAEAELAIAQRQLAVAAQVGVEDLHVARTVHRLDREVALLRLGEKHVLLVVFPVA